jgi:predicted HicB family RNase H-like nuclease
VKRLNTRLPDELHARVKGRAGMTGRTLEQYVIDALTETVERDEAEATERERRQKRP